tara:strand:- start:7780 stop:8064 length:285 start_codon:yes stop_codon:yes gene_type:complete
VVLQEKFLFYSDFNGPFCFVLNERILMYGDSANRNDAEGVRVVAETLIRTVPDINLLDEHSSAAAFVTISAGVSAMVPSNDSTPRSPSELADAV